MAQHTDLFTQIDFPDKTYNSRLEVINDLDKVKERIQTLRFMLLGMCYMTEPNKFKNKGDSDWTFVFREYNAIIEELSELFVEKYKLELLFERWNLCHDEAGFAIETPDDMSGRSFLSGEFVYTDKYPDNKSFFQ